MMIVAQSGVSSGFSARQLWDEMCCELSDDFKSRHVGVSWEFAFNRALIDIRRRLARHGKTLKGEGPNSHPSLSTIIINLHSGLPACTDNSTELGREEEHWSGEVDRLQAHVAQWIPLFNLGSLLFLIN